MDAAPRGISPLRSRRVVAFVSARTLSAAASQIQAVAVGWQIYALTHRALALGLAGAAQFLPVFCLVFVAGHVLDRFDRSLVARICLGVDTAGAALLATGTALHVLTPPMIYALVALFGAARAFQQPAMQSLLPNLVARADYAQAAALSSSLYTTATIVAPALGGLLYGIAPAAPYALAALGFASASVALAIAGRRPVADAQPAAARPPVTLASVFGGVAFLRSEPAVLAAISLDLFAVLLGGATALLPVYARDILHAGPTGLGALRAAPAIGALAGSLLLARHPLRRRTGAVMFGAVAVFGLATIVFGLSRSLTLSVAVLAVAGCADVVSVVIRSTLVQLRTPDAMRGRVAAVNTLFIGSSNELGEFESGVLASLVGAVPAVVLGGVGTLVVVGMFAWRVPGLRQLDRIE